MGKVSVKLALRSDGVSGPVAKDELLLFTAKKFSVKKRHDTALGHVIQERR